MQAIGYPDSATPPRRVRYAALVRRERHTRFSGGVLGYLWAYATPVAWIVFVVLSFHLLGRVPPLAIGSEIFVATGILPYILFRLTITSMMRSLIANRYLTYFQPLKGQDLLFASALLELVNMIVTSVVIFGAIILLFDAPTPHNLLEVYIAMALAWALGAASGSFFAAIGQWSDSFARAVPLLLRPMFWISGIFYTAAELPGGAQELLWWNPLFHIIELLREGFFLGYQSPIASMTYPLLIIIGFYLASGIVTRFVVQTRRTRHRL